METGELGESPAQGIVSAIHREHRWIQFQTVFALTLHPVSQSACPRRANGDKDSRHRTILDKPLRL